MLCEHYKEALSEAAASGAEPSGELRLHLDGCASCRAAVEQEQVLFASIDEGLRVTANADVPTSLLRRVRERLGEEVASQRHRFQPLIFATASVVLAIAIFLFARSPHSRPNSLAKQTPQIPIRETPVNSAPRENSGAAPQIVSSNANKSKTQLHSTLLRSVASSQPEVLVPPDEREAYARFVATLQKRSEAAVALVTVSSDLKGEPASLRPLRIDPLEVKPLEGTESEESDGAKKMR